jgi:outer membrane protein OmpA-like peptidoglycan-associated protein
VCSVAFGTSNPPVDTPAANTPTPTPTPTPTASTPAVGTAAALAALPKSSTQPKLKFAASDNGLSSSAKKSLKKVAKVAKTGYAVRVTGAAGMQAGVSETTVKALAKKRAMAIRAYLIKQGVPKEDIIIKTKVFPIGKAPVTKVKVEVIK